MALAKFAKTCAKNVSGNTLLCLAHADDVSTVTVTAGEISAVTMASGKYFYEIDAEVDTVQRQQEGEGIGLGNNVQYTHRITAKFAKPTTELVTLQNAIADASPCGMIAIVADANGQCWMVGYSEVEGTKRGLKLASDTLDSGVVATDEEGNMTTIVLERATGYPDLPFDATNNGTITGGTATYIDWN